MFLVYVAEKGHVWYVIIKFMVLHEVSRLLVFFTASITNIFLGCHVAILSHENHGDDEDEYESVEDTN
jgi:hypothetical protein